MFQISLFSTFFFERTAQNSASFSWYSRKIQRLQPWEIIGRKKKTNKKEKSLSWKGTSTWGTPQLNSLGWIGTTTQRIHISTLIRLNWSINTDKHSKLQSHGGSILSRQVNKLARPTEATTSLDLPLPFSCIWDRLSTRGCGGDAMWQLGWCEASWGVALALSSKKMPCPSKLQTRHTLLFSRNEKLKKCCSFSFKKSTIMRRSAIFWKKEHAHYCPTWLFYKRICVA